MPGIGPFQLEVLDYLAFGAYFVLLCFVGIWVGRRKKTTSGEYFLAGRSLPWYVVGGSFIASNISSEHFIGMIGGAYVYGICVANFEWLNVGAFSLLIWVFIPFLLFTRVFTIPEFLEKRFNPALRQIFAIITVVSNVLAFLAAVLYGGGLALQSLFGWSLWFSILALGVVAGSWAVYGGLRSVAWTDFLTVLIMLAGGIAVTWLGLERLGQESGSLTDGIRVLVERNQATGGVWAEAVGETAPRIVGEGSYNRLSVIQPVTHELVPWPSLIFMIFSVSIWYNVLNQFMIQRVLGARDMYHARMGIVLAGYVKILLPVIVVVPGLILFARHPEVLLLPWDEVKPEADKGYVNMLQDLVPAGLRGLFLAALFGAIQSTVNSVLNSTATIFTLDIYKRIFRRDAAEPELVKVGMLSSTAILLVSMLLAGFIGLLSESLFEYIQSLYAFFAPPFAAIFLLGILFRRINGPGATAAVVTGFVSSVLIKVWVGLPDHPLWLEPFAMQAIVCWLLCILVCISVSLLTPPPAPDKVTERHCIHWRRLDLLAGLGDRWYRSVVFWWLLFVAGILVIMLLFSGIFF